MKSSAYRRRREYEQMPPEERALVAVMNNGRDMIIAQNQGWYRIPVHSAPNQMDFGWLAFYQTKVFKDEGSSVNYFGRVTGRTIVKRWQLFPNEATHPRAEEDYYKITFSKLERLPRPIKSRRNRPLVFISTTLQKLQRATEINDLFHESPLEDDLWEVFKQKNIEAERQWYLKMARQCYCLDFAIFCRNRSLDVECDGDTWHSQPDRIAQDNERDSTLTSRGWAVLRFNSRQVWREMNHCLDRVCETINHYGGVVTPEEGQKLYVTGDGMPQQMSFPMEKPINFGNAVD